jgi:predicted metal-dependent peptidase
VSEFVITKEMERLLTEARLNMLLKMPYYGNFILGVDMIPDPKLKHTLGTDGRVIKYNPEKLLTQPRDKIVAYLAHEVLHISFKHPLRRSHRDPELWNLACDFVVNPILLEAKIGIMPEQYAYDARFANMTAEAVYDILEDKANKHKPQSGGKQPQRGKGQMYVGGGSFDMDSPDPGGMGAVGDPKVDDGEGGVRNANQAEMQAIEAGIDGKVASAAQMAKGQGKLPAGLERLLTEALKPKIDWKDRMKKFVAKTIPTDFTWMRPSRRGLANGLTLPSAIKNGCGKILVIIDTSGSIGNEELKQYWGEVCAIFEDCNPEELIVMYCDAAVAGMDRFTFGETPVLKPRGGGGTDFRPPFTKVNKESLNPQCAVYLTDGYGTFPEKEPPYPVLWVITSDVKSPHGETLPLRL